MLLVAFILKHFICDYLLQFPYHYKNKGTYGHMGGINHALIHALGTLALCFFFELPLWFAGADLIIHYHIDWAKMRLNHRYGWQPTTSEKFWWLLGFDQTLHYLTYAAFISYATL